MCTNIMLVKSESVNSWANGLGLDPEALHYSDNLGPSSKISIVVVSEAEVRLKTAMWWLYLRQGQKGMIPHTQYFSVNTNYAKLPKKPEFKRSRCVIPVSGFAESQNGKNPHLLTREDGKPILLGGLWKYWHDKVTGETVYSASVITLPSHDKLTHIHQKSIPLWLDDSELESWLDPHVQTTSMFDKWLKGRILSSLVAQPIDKVGTKRPIAPSELIEADYYL